MEEELNALRKVVLKGGGCPAALARASAKYILLINPRDNVPDWVEILANGNISIWDDVIAVALEDMEADEAMDNMEKEGGNERFNCTCSD